MRWLTFLYAALGVGLLIWVLAGVDLDQALESTLGIGWGLAVVMAIYLVAFYIDSISWHLAIVQTAPDRQMVLYHLAHPDGR